LKGGCTVQHLRFGEHFWKEISESVLLFYLGIASVKALSVEGIGIFMADKIYSNLQRRSNDVRENAKKLRRQYLRYKDAEIVYGISHKKLLELAGKAGAIYRMDSTVLINRDIFDEYLEQFHEPSTLSVQGDEA